MKLTPKYKIGDRHHDITERTQQIPCKECEGSGRVRLKAGDYHCPACGQRGYIYWKTTVPEIMSLEVRCVIQCETAGCEYVCYGFSEDPTSSLYHGRYVEEAKFCTREAALDILEKKKKENEVID